MAHYSTIDYERIQRLHPIDDEFMRCIFKDRPELVQEVLRTITGIDDLEIIEAETARDINRIGKARSVVLDVYGRDKTGKIYNIEVQRSEAGANPKRARYHSAVLDVEELAAGDNFDLLPESYIIFITEQDYFKQNKGIYHFKRLEEDSIFPLGDETHILYANARYNSNDTLGDLMHDFLCSNPNDMKTEALAKRCQEFKENEKGAEKMGWFTEEIRAEALEEGREEGLKEGILSLLADGLITIDVAASRLHKSEDDIRLLIKEQHPNQA